MFADHYGLVFYLVKYSALLLCSYGTLPQTYLLCRKVQQCSSNFIAIYYLRFYINFRTYLRDVTIDRPPDLILIGWTWDRSLHHLPILSYYMI